MTNMQDAKIAKSRAEGSTNSVKRPFDPFTDKPLTSYKPALAIRRIRFYTDVLEAHFAMLGLVLTPKREGESAEESEREKRETRETPHEA